MIYKFAILPRKCGKCNKIFWLNKYIHIPAVTLDKNGIDYKVEKIAYCKNCSSLRMKLVCEGCFYADVDKNKNIKCKIKDKKLCEPLGRLRYTMGID